MKLLYEMNNTVTLREYFEAILTEKDKAILELIEVLENRGKL